MEILKKANIVTGCAPEHYEDVIRRCGRMLVENGYVRERYIEGMISRNKSFSTAIGNGIAIPHGEMEYKQEILKTGLVVLTYPEGLDWDGERVKIVVGIAAKGDEHLEILSRIADSMEDEKSVDDLVAAGDRDSIYRIFVTEGAAE